MIGLWDTIGALGFTQLADGVTNYFTSETKQQERILFLNAYSYSLVLSRYHALPIYERINIFKPILWNKENVDEVKNSFTGDNRRMF